MLVLFAVPQSPYCAKVRGALQFKKIRFEEREPAGGSYQTTEYQETVAAGSVPAIMEGDWVLHDSQAIVEYLHEQYPGPELWDTDPKRRGLQRALLNYHDSKLEPAVRELVPLVGKAPGPERDLEIGLVCDRLYDRLFRLDRMLGDALFDHAATGCAADWTIPATVAIAVDLMGYLERTIEMPGRLGAWLDAVTTSALAAAERDRVRAAIKVWLELQAERAAQPQLSSVSLN